MFFSISFYIAFVIFAAGTLYKISTWFRFRVGPESEKTRIPARVFSAGKGMITNLLSRKLFTLVRVFLLDGVFQFRILRESVLRWVIHILIFAGFMLLFFMHALGGSLTIKLFPEYYATVNPFWFLRDLFGAMVILGIAIAVYRRFIRKQPAFANHLQDVYAILILSVILLSGILLSGVKITSYAIYQDMVYTYMDFATEEEQSALEAYWVADFGVVPPHPIESPDSGTLDLGKEMHEMSCAECHARPQTAPLSYGVSRLVSPIAPLLDRASMPKILWYIHYLACLIGLAYLPFSKMFHIFTGPISLMVNAVSDEKSDPANIATRQALELDACTHCGSCTQNCSMRTAFETIPNPDIFPSEKISAIKSLAAGKSLADKKFRDLREGVCLCTNCMRCTVVCPVGINLQEMWFSVRERLTSQGQPEFLTLSPFSFYRALLKERQAEKKDSQPAKRAREALFKIYPFRRDVKRPVALNFPAAGVSEKEKSEERTGGKALSADAQTFAYCFGCETCTTVCPVVANYENAEQVLGLLPHQIMHCLALGMREATLGTAMLWNCLTCYQCQEQCPQGVRITDVFYELKNLAIQKQKEESPQTGESVS